MKRIAIGLILLLAGTVGVSLWIDDPEPPADFVFVNRGEVFTLDPQRMSWMQDFRMAYALYEPLVRWNNDDFTIEPAAAEMPQVGDDGLTYTFHIREDARWSNGDPLTAHDYIYSWKRALLPDTAADYSMMFFAIEGGRAFFDWRTAQLNEFASAHAQEGRSINAVELWNASEAHFKQSVGLRAIGDRTLEVTLEKPLPYFLDLVAFGVFHPVHRPTVEGWIVDDATRRHIREHGWHAVEPPPFENRRWVALNPNTARLEQKHEWTKPDHIVTNGPYVLTRWRYRRGMRLEVNPLYHSPEIVKSASIACLSIDDANTGVLAFESGDIDWLSDVSTDYQADLLAEAGRYRQRRSVEIDAALARGESMQRALASLPPPEPGERRNIHAFPTFGTDFYSFNCRPTLASGRDNPFHHPAVRRAFVLSVDRQAIVEHVTRLNEPVVTTFVPPGSIPGYDNPEGLGYDPERAREELASTGWEDRDGDGVVENESGDPFPVIDLLFSTNTPRYKNISLALRDMWQRELRVSVELRGKDNKAFKEDLKSGNFMIGRGRWYGDYGDPTTFLDINKTGDGNNDRGYSNQYVDSLLEQASQETDPQKRMDLLEECERYLFQEDPPMIVLCQLLQLYMFDPAEVRGLSTHPRLTQYLWEIEVTE